MLRSGNDRKSVWAHPKESGSSHQGPWISKANGNAGGNNNNVKYIRASNFHLLGHNKAYSNISKSTNALDYAPTKVNPKQYPYYAPMSVSSHHSSSRLPNSNKINSAAIEYNSRKHFSQLQQPQKCTCSSNNNNNNNYCSNDLKVQSHYRNMQMQRSSRLATNQSKLFEIARNNMLLENSKNYCNCNNNKNVIHSKSMEDIRALPTVNNNSSSSNNNHNHINNNHINNNSTKFKHQISASASNDENATYSTNKFVGGNFNWKYKRHSMDNLFDGGMKAFESNFQNDANRPHFVAVTTLEDVQAVRCAEFHPSGRVYAVGSNSKTFRICEYPSLSEVREEHTTYQPTVLFKRTKHHKGSIYCMGWAPDGELVATGSNDKTIKLMRYDEIKKQLEGREIELTMHDGTVRDLCFLEDSSNKASLLISGGAGDCKIYVTDCATATPFQALSGHGGHILSLYNWGGAMFVSGSQDKTIRFWDLRTRGCVNTITPATSPGTRQGSPVAAVCVDPSGRLLVSGHEDSSCVLYDIRGNRPIQCFKPHASDVRSIRFSPSAYYLLTAGYDNKLVLTDLQGDLTLPLPSVVVAHHADKVISGRWHPTDFSFLSTSADKTATLWALPPL